MADNKVHSRHLGYLITIDSDSKYYVSEPYLNHQGILRHREIGCYSEHREAREYIAKNCMDWMAIHDKLDNSIDAN